MAQILFVIESPGKKKTLEKILGPGYKVMASFGHVRDLPLKELGIDLVGGQLAATYVVPSDKAKRVSELKAAAKACSSVILATDLDREGEAIAWHLAEIMHLKKPVRVTYDQVTEAGVKKGLASPRPLNMDLVRAQEARRVLDRLVGYQVRKPISDATNQKLSAGRVQSPAVRLVVDRERAIRSFVPVTHYGAEIQLGGYKAAWKPVLVPGQEYCFDEALAKSAASITSANVSEFADFEQSVGPEPPFTTATLQRSAQTKLKIKPEATMLAAQGLYEAGLITYMRTDSPNLSDSAIAEIMSYASKNNMKTAGKPRKFPVKASAQEAHEAIRPTHIDCLSAGKNEDEKRLYKLIWERAVASQLADAKFAVRSATLQSGQFTYGARGKTLTSPGWKSIYDEQLEDDLGDDANPIPALKIGQSVTVQSGKALTKKTKAPARYTQVSLTEDMEKHGIGRPSTYVSILKVIMGRGYISEGAKDHLFAQPLGETLVDVIVGKFSFADISYTGHMESELDLIATGKKTYIQVMQPAQTKLIAEINDLCGTAPKFTCECCKPMRRKEGFKGPFWGCTGYPECKITLPDDNGVPGVRKSVSPVPNASAPSAH